MEKLPSWSEIQADFFETGPLKKDTPELVFNCIGADLRMGVKCLPHSILSDPCSSSKLQMVPKFMGTSGVLYFSNEHLAIRGSDAKGIRLSRFNQGNPIHYGRFVASSEVQVINNLDRDFVPHEQTLQIEETLQAISQLYLFCFWMAQYEKAVIESRKDVNALRTVFIKNNNIVTLIRSKIRDSHTISLRDFWLAKAQLLRNIYAMYQKENKNIGTTQF